jgi:hypothetical protein
VTTLGEALLPLVVARPRRGPGAALLATGGVLALAVIGVVATWLQVGAHSATQARGAAAASEPPAAPTAPVAASAVIEVAPPGSSATPPAIVPPPLPTSAAPRWPRAKEAPPAPSHSVRPRPNPYEHM